MNIFLGTEKDPRTLSSSFYFHLTIGFLQNCKNELSSVLGPALMVAASLCVLCERQWASGRSLRLVP